MIAIALFIIAFGAILWIVYELITAPKVDLYGNLRPSDGLTPAKFPEANVEFAKDQPEYKSLPAFRNQSLYGEVITCWKLSFAQRLKLLVAGRLWVSVWTFNEKLQPMYLTSDKHDVLIVKKSWQLRVVQKFDQWRNRLRFKYSLAKAVLTEHIGNIVRGGVR